MCLVYIAVLRLNIKPRAFYTCVSISTYRARKSYISEWGQLHCSAGLCSGRGAQSVWSCISFGAVNCWSKHPHWQRALAISSRGLTKIFKFSSIREITKCGIWVFDFRLSPRSGWELPSAGYYAASSDNFLPTFRDQLAAPSSGFKNQNPFRFLTHEGGNDRLSRNVQKKLPLLVSW